MDQLDLAILDHIQHDAKAKQADIARAAGVAVSTVNDRLQRLQHRGVVVGFEAHVAPDKLGFSVCAFVQVLIAEPEHEREFISKIRQLDQVQECHCITGDFSYLLKVRALTPANLEQFLRDDVKSIPGVVRTNTLIALSTAKETSALPLKLL